MSEYDGSDQDTDWNDDNSSDQQHQTKKPRLSNCYWTNKETALLLKLHTKYTESGCFTFKTTMWKQISADLKKYLNADRTPDKCNERVKNMRAKAEREKTIPIESTAFETIYRSDGTNELDVPERLANERCTTGRRMLQETMLEIQELAEATMRRRNTERCVAREKNETLKLAAMDRNHCELVAMANQRRPMKREGSVKF